MKKLAILSLLLVTFWSCQNDNKAPKKEEQNSKEKLQTTQWVLNEDASSIHWTGYKTTGKIPVKGVFKTFKIIGVKPAKDLKTMLQHAQAEITIASIFSNNEDRDKKLIGKLFGNMTDTDKIHGRIEKLASDGLSATLNVNMNAHEKLVPVQIKIDENAGQISLNGKIDLLKDFQADQALNQFHKACFDKHKGADGVSKTWSEVGFKVILIFDKK